MLAAQLLPQVAFRVADKPSMEVVDDFPIHPGKAGTFLHKVQNTIPIFLHVCISVFHLDILQCLPYVVQARTLSYCAAKIVSLSGKQQQLQTMVYWITSLKRHGCVKFKNTPDTLCVKCRLPRVHEGKQLPNTMHAALECRLKLLEWYNQPSSLGFDDTVLIDAKATNPDVYFLQVELTLLAPSDKGVDNILNHIAPCVAQHVCCTADILISLYSVNI
mmetsp:Transcript_75502/g.133670  ORF Transcript_75502/g.133670 Transcript_75502/m.133670 type:complete len:218 (-) Transcript_75502:209-862(-)